ncbi:hypothetical protein Taro_048134 [Colocasia esculenta]|uniref:Auxin-responsive protein SAUR36 n=1 Tax=Colocasia esculenta TaxID=4460 RepID=A0A843WUY2_COLES|nr:hypothetical protein [Colocasia esculenta]
MISYRRLTQMATKWLRVAAAGRKRIAFHTKGAATALDSETCSRATPARKGHFVVYSCDGRRFEVPLALLKSKVFGELLEMSEEVFGLAGDGAITLPWDATFVGSVVSCLRPSGDADRAVLASMATTCSASLGPCSLVNRPLVVCGR